MSRGVQRARLDSNHVAMVEALRGIGAFVQSLATVGCGCPDLLVGYRGKWMLIEAKDGENIPSKRVLTDYEKRWHHSAKACGALIIIAESPEQAVVQVITEGGETVKDTATLLAEYRANRSHQRAMRQVAEDKTRPRLPRMIGHDWTQPAQEGYKCDMCQDERRPAPHAGCEAKRAKWAAALNVLPEGYGKHGRSQSDDHSGRGVDYSEPYQRPGNSGMKRTGEGGELI